MNKAGNLLVHKNKDHQTNAEVNHIKTHGCLRKKLYALTHILLAFLISSNEMMRVVHMFSEVIFVDVTANTNKQGRGLHLLVVNDADGSIHIGNATVIPSEQRWVFNIFICSLCYCLAKSPSLILGWLSPTTTLQNMTRLTRAYTPTNATKSTSTNSVSFMPWS